MENADQSNAPRDVLRDGNLKASIWRNESEKGPFYSVTLNRVYRDNQDELRDSHSFSGTDLLRLSELARKTYDRAQELRREDRQAERNGSEQSQAPLLDQHDREQRKADFEARRTQPEPARNRSR